MKSTLKIKTFLIRFIFLISLVIPYSLSIISIDIFLKQEVSLTNLEIKSNRPFSSDSLFLENSDDTDETNLPSGFSIAFCVPDSCVPILFNKAFVILFKIPFELHNIPPPIST